MPKICIALIATVLLGACGGATKDGPPRAPLTGSHRSDPDPSIYAAVIRQLVTKDHGFGQAPSPYKMVYVLDGPVAGAEDPNKTLTELHPQHAFSREMKRRIIRELSGLPPMRFVSRRSQVVVGTRKGAILGHVKGRGVLITLGPIIKVGSTLARVGNNLWANGLNGQWLTYEVTERNSNWSVTGVVGNSAAIS